MIVLHENPNAVTLVARNSDVVWRAMLAHNSTFKVQDENMDYVLFEFGQEAERNHAIHELNRVQNPWPQDYNPQPRA